MADKKTLNIEAMLATEMGATVKDMNPDGTLDIEVADEATGEAVVKKFNLPKMMAEEGIDPSKHNIHLNSPETASTKDTLSFATKLELSIAEDPKSQMKVLADEYGEENVKLTENGIVVKERGVWKQADSSFMSDITSTLPEIAGGIAGRAAGAAAGAAIGSAVPIVGTAAGGVIGGIIGGAGMSALAKVIKDKGAEYVGIKTEYDADKATEVFGKEMAWNMAIDSTLGAVGWAWRGFGKPMVKQVGRAMKGATTAAVEGDKYVGAQLLETVVPGSSRNDWMTVMRTPRDAEKVLAYMGEMDAWGKLKASSSVMNPIDPLTQKTSDLAEVAIKGAKSRAMKQYETGIKLLEDSGATTNAKVDLTKVAAGFQKSLGELGLLYKDEAGMLKLTRRARPGNEAIMQVFDAKSINTLSKMFDQMNTLLRTDIDPILGELAPKTIRAKPMSFGDTKKLLSGIDDILESSGYYNGGEAAMSNNARRALMKLRRDVNEAMIGSLSNVKIKGPAGQLTSAADHYRKVANQYSKFREVYDDFAVIGDDRGKAAATVNRMLGEKGANIETIFQEMLNLSGVDASAVIPRLQQLRAARNLSEIYNSNKGLVSALKANVGIGSPRYTAETLAEKTIAAGKKIAPLNPVSKTKVEAMARGVEWSKKLTPAQRLQLMSTPILAREFGKSVLGAPAIQQDFSQQLEQQVPAE